MKKFITTMAFVCVFLFSNTAFAGALFFDGSNDYVSAGDVLFNSLTDQLTLEAWVKPIDTGSGFAKPIIRKYGEASNGSCCPVGSFGLSYYGYQNLDRMLFGVEERGLDSPNGVIVGNEWVHVAAVYDGTKSTMELYLNGALSSTVPHSGDIDQIFTELSFGGTPQKISEYRFYGIIDEIRIWDVALSQAEIQKNLYKELIGDEQGLIGYWNFNEGSGDIAYDSSGSGNDGTLVGTPDWVEDSPIVSPPVPEPSIMVDSPDGGEYLSAGEAFEITWTSEGDIDFVKIEYSANNGTDWTEIIDSTGNDGSYDWGTPCDLSEESLVRISDVDSDVSDESDEVFSIIDDSPPSVTALVDKDHLWPPNHKMVDVGFDYSVTDNCDAEPDISIEVTSDEPTATAPGAGGSKHAPDAEINNSALLRAERSGKGDGRVYQIVVTATDESGNSVSEAVNVKVNKSKKKEALDSGQFYDATEIN